MPDLRISQLPNNPAPIGLNDVFPIVPQGSIITYKDTMQDLANFIAPIVTGQIGLPPIAGQSGEWLTNNGTSIFWSPLPTPPIPTLDQVLGSGNSSNKDFVLTGTNGDIVVDGQDFFVGNEPTFLIRNLLNGKNHRLLIDRSIYNNNGYQLDIISPTLDNSYVLRYPKDTNYLVTKVNGIAANSGGEITIPVGGSQTLQTTLGLGNSATIPININAPTINPDFTGIKVFDGDVNDMQIRPTSIYFNGEEGITKLNFINQTGGQIDINTPQANGTLALSVNGNLSDVNGNISININDIGVPTLDQVLTQSNNANGQDIVGVNGLGATSITTFQITMGGYNMYDTGLGIGITQPSLFIPGVELGDGVYISNFATDGGRIRADNLTGGALFTPADRTYQLPNILPNTTQTFALSVNGIYADVNGNITIPGATTPSLEEVMAVGNTSTYSLELQGAGIIGTDFIDFDTTPILPITNQEGRVQWNSDLKTIQVDTENSGVQINLGHETIQRVRNVTGATLTKGKIVYINGESGNRPTITLSSNTSDATSAQTIGFVIADIPNNNNGYVITNGLLEDINTTGIPSGTQLFLGTNGNFQTTFPTQPLHNVRVGIVINGNSVNGSVFVNILNGYEIEELHDVLITSPQNDQVLTYETSSGLWKNKVIPTQTPQLKTIEGQSLLGTGNIDLVKADVGLSNVDNTSDLNKPISTATQTALNNKQDTLVSATNIKTINGSSVLGSGDLSVVANVKTLAGVSLSGTGNVTLDQILPTQTGNSGRVLKTNGTTASWQDDFTGPGGSSDGYCLHLGYAAWTPTLASNTWTTGWFYGQNPDTLFNDRPSRRFIVPKSGIIKSVTILTALGTAGSGVTQTLTISVHNITQGITSQIVTGYSIASGSLISLSRQDIYSGLSIPVTAGDVCHIRIVTPTFTTAPTGLSQIFNLFIEQ